jgi:pimeloyl-ACP methyl ester carboxylesterase
MRLSTGAELRVTGPLDAPAAVVCVNGGQAGRVEGTWSASLEWLVRRLAPRFPALAFAEVRYRIKSWNTLDWCVEDARAAVTQIGARRTLLLGFSMGGAVSVRTAEDSSVETMLGLAPWLPEQISLEPLRGKRLRVLHGSLDRALPGIPGVAPAFSRRAFERALALGVDGEYTLIPGGLHGVAVRARSGKLIALPRASNWASLVEEELAAFERG